MISIACGAMLAAFGRPAHAQSPGDTSAGATDEAPRDGASERPYRGIFGGGVGDVGQLLTTSLSLDGGYVDDMLSQPVGDTTGTLPPSFTGPFSAASGELAYSFKRDRATFNASAGASARYYDARKDIFPAYSAAVGGSATLTPRLTLTGDLTATAEPLYGLTLLPDAVAPDPGTLSPIDYTQGVASGDYRSVRGSTALDYAFSDRTSVDVHYEASRGELGDEPREQTVHGAGVSIHHQFTQGVGARLGYSRQLGAYELADGSRDIRNDTIDAGLDYSRALSLSRRTSLAFTTGTTAVSDGESTFFRLVGSATLERQIGRTWNAALIYNRDVGFVQTLVEPTFSDGLAIAVGGLIGRRLELQTQVAATVGQIGFGHGDSATGFDAYDATAGLTVALSRYLAVNTSYTYYRYTFDSDAPLSGAVFRRLDRQSVQAGLTLWAPLLHRTRRSHAAR
jgi:hypothetical protein